MLHPTNMSDCEQELQLVLGFQERLLEFACRSSNILQKDLEAEYGIEVANWLHANRQMVLDHLKQFALQPQVEKDAVLADFQHDRKYPAGKDDPTFKFALQVSTTPSEAQRLAKDWCIGFYKQFAEKRGFPPPILGTGCTEIVHRHRWLARYGAANSTPYTCAVCDGSLKDGTTAEHYFPKSRYPALSVHPHNLLPLCKECNNVYKGNKDPLAGRDITQVFLPYHRFVRHTARLTCYSSLSTGIEQIVLEPIIVGSKAADQLNALSELFSLPQQWQKNIHEIAGFAKGKLRDYLDYLREDGKAVRDKIALQSAIDKACTQMQKDWGVFHYFYPATEWLRWARDNKIDALYAELIGPAGP